MAEEATEVEIDDDDGGGFEAAAVSRSSHRRPDHMSELVRIRREAMRLLFPTGTGGIDEDKADDDDDEGLATILYIYHLQYAFVEEPRCQ
jgi:hypothetical protein